MPLMGEGVRRHARRLPVGSAEPVVELSFSRTGEFSGILDHPLSRVMTRVTSASSSTCFAAGENLARADLQLVAHMTILLGREIHHEMDARPCRDR
jgi:hypothetical protein